MATVKPANAQQTATRRKELWLAYTTKVFDYMKRHPDTPVPLTGPLSDRSEILLGLKEPGETNDAARARLVARFVKENPLVSAGPAIDARLF
jgi:hypothetical protein